jgi:hypothetical protein
VEEITLCVLPAGTPLVSAWVTMRARKQSGMVRIAGERLDVITATSVVKALRAHQKSIAEVSDAAPVRPPDDLQVSTRGIRRTPRGVPLSVPADTDHMFAVISLEFGEAVLATVHSGLISALNIYPAGCRCEMGEYWEPWEAPISRICPNDFTRVRCGQEND